MNKNKFSNGFSAVELLITLFIAFLFVMMGYQLYSVSIKDGGDARSQAKASNIAYKYLRKYAFGNCSNQGIKENNTPASDGGLASATVTVTATCANTALGILMVKSTVRYGSPQKELSHAVYARQ